MHTRPATGLSTIATPGLLLSTMEQARRLTAAAPTAVDPMPVAPSQSHPRPGTSLTSCCIGPGYVHVAMCTLG
jgi:hypothetical protein